MFLMLLFSNAAFLQYNDILNIINTGSYPKLSQVTKSWIINNSTKLVESDCQNSVIHSLELVTKVGNIKNRLFEKDGVKSLLSEFEKLNKAFLYTNYNNNYIELSEVLVACSQSVLPTFLLDTKENEALVLYNEEKRYISNFVMYFTQDKSFAIELFNYMKKSAIVDDIIFEMESKFYSNDIQLAFQLNQHRKDLLNIMKNYLITILKLKEIDIDMSSPKALITSLEKFNFLTILRNLKYSNALKFKLNLRNIKEMINLQVSYYGFDIDSVIEYNLKNLLDLQATKNLMDHMSEKDYGNQWQMAIDKEKLLQSRVVKAYALVMPKIHSH